MAKIMECHSHDYISLHETLTCQSVEEESLGSLKEANSSVVNCICNHMVGTYVWPVGIEGSF